MSAINPKIILDKGILQLPKDVDVSKVLQPNGIDLNVLEVFEIGNNPLVLGDDVPTKHRYSEDKKLEELSFPYKQDGYSKYEGLKGFRLERGKSYKVETGYKLTLPEDMIAYIFTRSSLNRNGVLTGSGLWDSGYTGFVGATLYAFQDTILIPPARIAQIVFFHAESALLYNGSYNDLTIKTNKVETN